MGYLSSLFEQHRLGEITDVEMFAKLKDKLIAESNGKLYRYRSFESKYSMPEVEKKYVFCANPSTFNDPFDCKMGFDVGAIMDAVVPYVLFSGKQVNLKTEDGMYEELSKIIDVEQLREKCEACGDINTACVEVMKESIGLIKNWLISLFPDMDDNIRNLVNHGLDMVLHTLDSQKAVFSLDGDFLLTESLEASLGQEIDADQIGKICSLSSSLDPTLGKEATALEKQIDVFLKEYEQKIDEMFAVSCFTTDNKNRLMWAHYAYNHEGFCIEYDLSGVDWAEGQLFLLPVEYSSKRPQIPVKEMVEISQNDDCDGVMNKGLHYEMLRVLAVKDENWSYENEWRLLTPGNVANRERPFPFISCLYVGARCSEANKEKLMKIANELNIPVKQMVIDRQWFDLHVRDV